ncbi:MAG: NADH-quinone oxidoreductase subunit NuoK [Chloroflexota bacterium]
MTAEAVVLITSAAIFALGAAGVLLRRNPVAVLMCVELMLNAANLVLVLGSHVQGNDAGQATALIVLVIAAAEAVVGLGLALVLFRHREPADIDEPRAVRG